MWSDVTVEIITSKLDEEEEKEEQKNDNNCNCVEDFDEKFFHKHFEDKFVVVENWMKKKQSLNHKIWNLLESEVFGISRNTSYIL